jgi:hypothetical protein
MRLFTDTEKVLRSGIDQCLDEDTRKYILSKFEEFSKRMEMRI